MERSLERRILTAEEFYALPDDEMDHELVEGWVTSEPMPGTRHGRVVIQLALALGGFVRAKRLGLVVNNAGFVLARDPDTVRGPDLAFVTKERVEEAGDVEGFFPGPPDLAVEILSPSNRPVEMRAKVADYLAAGTRLVWVVDPGGRKVRAYRSLLAPRVLGPHDELDGEDVLPGFRLRVAELFEA